MRDNRRGLPRRTRRLAHRDVDHDCAAGEVLAARHAKVDRLIVVSVFQSDYAVANAELARIIARHPNRLIGFAFVHPSGDAGRIRHMVSHAVRQWNFRGIMVHGIDAMPTREVCDVAKEFALPILVDVAGRAHVIDMFAQSYPEVDFITPHLGSYADDWRVYIQVIEKISRYPNVYTDTSGVRRFDQLAEAVRSGGSGKVIFASDGPWLHPGLELHKIKLPRLGPEDERQILGENNLRLMRKRRVANLIDRQRSALRTGSIHEAVGEALRFPAQYY